MKLWVRNSEELEKEPAHHLALPSADGISIWTALWFQWNGKNQLAGTRYCKIKPLSLVSTLVFWGLCLFLWFLLAYCHFVSFSLIWFEYSFGWKIPACVGGCEGKVCVQGQERSTFSRPGHGDRRRARCRAWGGLGWERAGMGLETVPLAFLIPAPSTLFALLPGPSPLHSLQTLPWLEDTLAGSVYWNIISTF